MNAVCLDHDKPLRHSDKVDLFIRRKLVSSAKGILFETIER